MDIQKPDWNKAKNLIYRRTFLYELATYNLNNISKEMLKKYTKQMNSFEGLNICKQSIKKGQFKEFYTPAIAKMCSAALAHLVSWMQAAVDYAEAMHALKDRIDSGDDQDLKQFYD